MAGLSYDPTITGNAANTFSNDSGGYIQGLEMDNPSVWQMLSGGYSADTLPIWGGMAIGESIPQGIVAGQNTGPKALGGGIVRASVLSGITGFTSFNKAHHMLSSPSSPVPMAFTGMSVHFYRLGSQARIPVACDPALASLNLGLINQQVSWDFLGQRLVPYKAAYGNDAITAATYNAGTGLATYTTVAAHGLVPGDDVSISGITPAGYNGSFTTLTGTTGSTIVVALPANPGGSGTAFGTVVGGGGALPVKVLDIAPSNCMTVVYDPVGGGATWNRNGACALILI